MKRYFWIQIADFWSSGSIWFGPFSSMEEAETAAAASGASRTDRGQMAADIRFGLQIVRICSATEAAARGRRKTNSLPAALGLPKSLHELAQMEENYL